jgi:hypothetical protein
MATRIKFKVPDYHSHATIDRKNATAVTVITTETVNIPCKKVGETDTLESVADNNAGL